MVAILAKIIKILTLFILFSHLFNSMNLSFEKKEDEKGVPDIAMILVLIEDLVVLLKLNLFTFNKD